MSQIALCGKAGNIRSHNLRGKVVNSANIQAMLGINSTDLHGQFTPYRLAAGLYDANDNLVASWDTLVNTYGMDVTKAYTSSTYNTDSASPYYVFTNNSELSTGTKLVIDDSITTIGGYMFSGCTSLTDIHIPDSVKSIGVYAFNDCASLTSITIPDSVTSIYAAAFYNCSSLTSMVIPDNAEGMSGGWGLASRNSSLFYGCTNLVSVTLGSKMWVIVNSTFGGCTSLATLNLPNTIKHISPNAFADCPNLQYTFYNNDTYLGNQSNPHLVFFKLYDKTLKNYSIHPNARLLANRSFSGCKASRIEIPHGITNLDEYVFDNLSALRSLIIPTTMKFIGYMALANDNITDIYYRGTEEQWAAIEIRPGNYAVDDATIHYNYTG